MKNSNSIFTAWLSNLNSILSAETGGCESQDFPACDWFNLWDNGNSPREAITIWAKSINYPLHPNHYAILKGE